MLLYAGNCTLLLEQQNKVPVFAFEEAIGYMCDPRVPDKDGVSAAVHVSIAVLFLYHVFSYFTSLLSFQIVTKGRQNIVISSVF